LLRFVNGKWQVEEVVLMLTLRVNLALAAWCARAATAAAAGWGRL
jgi:hypothetical protein